jgi:hypothetical protein
MAQRSARRSRGRDEVPPSEGRRRAQRVQDPSGRDAEAPDPEALDEIGSEDDAHIEGYDPDAVPESQGAGADGAFGKDAQGMFGDEDYDPSYGPKGLAGPEEIDISERGADTPDRIDWDETEGDAADAVSNEERDVATGDLAALEEVPKKTAWAEEGGRVPQRPDDRIREDIEGILEELGESGVAVEISEGEVVLLGVVDTDERRDLIDERVQEVDAVTAIDNRITVRDEGNEAEDSEDEESE